jgi:hypothetical protein
MVALTSGGISRLGTLSLRKFAMLVICYLPINQEQLGQCSISTSLIHGDSIHQTDILSHIIYL